MQFSYIIALICLTVTAIAAPQAPSADDLNNQKIALGIFFKNFRDSKAYENLNEVIDRARVKAPNYSIVAVLVVRLQYAKNNKYNFSPQLKNGSDYGVTFDWRTRGRVNSRRYYITAFRESATMIYKGDRGFINWAFASCNGHTWDGENNQNKTVTVNFNAC